MDVLGTMENPSLPLTLEDREEWGDPVENPKHRLTISSYCPLNNITPQVRTCLCIGLRHCVWFNVSFIEFAAFLNVFTFSERWILFGS